MDEDTLTALRGSIAKWEAIVAGTGEDHGIINCTLCEKFRWNNDGHSCRGCPVKDNTGLSGCWGTPYDRWADRGVHRVIDEETREIAKAELDFLHSLLPDAEREIPVGEGEMATCETHGHIRGHDSLCVFCKSPVETTRRSEQWDAWYSSLPPDLMRKLSIHDFKRLGDCFKKAFEIGSKP